MTTKKILFIGGGNMTRVILAGLIANQANPASITVIDRHGEKRDFFQKLMVYTARNPRKIS